MRAKQNRVCPEETVNSFVAFCLENQKIVCGTLCRRLRQALAIGQFKRQLKTFVSELDSHGAYSDCTFYAIKYFTYSLTDFLLT